MPDGPLSRFIIDPGGTFRGGVDAAVSRFQSALPMILAVVVAVALAAVVVLAVRWRQRAALSRGGRVVTILSPPDVEVEGAEALWRNLHDLLRPRWRRALYGQPHLGFEYAWSADGLAIRMWVPDAVPGGLVERAVEAAWPAARTETTPAEDQPLLPEGAVVLGGRMRLALPAWYPLRTDTDPDPLRALLGAGAPARPDEAAAVAVLARPAGARATAGLRGAARDLRRGRSPRRLGGVADLLLSRAATPRASADPAIAPDVRAVLDKAASPLWSVVVRYGVATTNADADHRVLRGRAHAVAAAFAVHAGRNRLVRRRLWRPTEALATRRLGRGDLLSTPELAALAHLPTDRIVPALARAGARAVPPPPAVERKPGTGKVLGDADAGGARPVLIRPQDARYHLHVMGATGSGKSTLLTNLVLDDVEAGRGVVVIDPKGDLVVDILDRLRSGDRARAIVLDPQAGTDPPTLNMLEVPEGVPVDIAVDHLVGICGRIFERHWGPRIEDVMRSACLTLLRKPGATLSDVPRLLTLPGEYQKYLDTGPEDDLRGFWAWYEGQSVAQRAQINGPLLYKLRAFLLRDYVRQVVNAPTSTLDMNKVLDGGILLARLPKGLLGIDAMRLLGSFIVAKTWQAATGRAALSQKARADSALVMDEFHNFLTLPGSWEEMLAEARGYGLGLVLAHQNLAQLPREVREGASANARNKVWFSMSPEDAYVLQRHTVPQLTEHDLANLGAYQAAVRLVVDGQDQPAFTLRTRPAREMGTAA